ncbi:serine/threonine-protein kinase [Paenarthrobacter sp. YIM B13468]|uniref:serine/threonine-protein kinase n=1 Tax=Paenarthrobacter sp. YIM B13468 TaxID=3366295 RepID=UPI00367236D7
MKVLLKGEWEAGAELGRGTFGYVLEAIGPNNEVGALKFIPKTAGAEREMLFETRLDGAKNVVPVVDSGEDADNWIIAMPKAEHSLRDEINKGPMDLSAAKKVLEDVTDGLADIKARGVIHRDLKPENILLINGSWCLADFGIARYAEAATAAAGTHKYSWTPAYAAPEQWRLEHATPATDMYALGVMAYELVTGARPFIGDAAALREAHLHDAIPASTAPKKLAWLIEECLAKAPASRPSPSEFRKRLDLSFKEQTSAGLALLQEANQAEAQKQAELARQRSAAKTEQERQSALADAGIHAFKRLSAEFLEVLTENAPGSKVAEGKDGSWQITLNNARLRLAPPSRTLGSWEKGYYVPSFEVVAASNLTLECLSPVRGYRGRAHSLWFGDIQAADDYGWFETAFIQTIFMRDSQPAVHPYDLPPTSDGANAIFGQNEHQHAWPFMKVDHYDLSEFSDRWAAWFAMASQGRLGSPHMLPERRPENSWRSK